MSLALEIERRLARAERARAAGDPIAEWEAIQEAERLLEDDRARRFERITDAARAARDGRAA